MTVEAEAPSRVKVRRYHPRGAALELFSTRAPEVVLVSGAGTGKTRAVLEKLHMVALLNPQMRGMIVRKTLASLGSTALVTWREHVIKEALTAGIVTFYGGSAQESPQYRYSNGSVITVGGLDKPSRIMSSEYDLIVCAEATELTETDWEALTTRLRNGKIPSGYHAILADCNPDVPHHWLKARADRGQVLMLESRHEDNPRLYDQAEDGSYKLTEFGAGYMERLDALTGVRYLRLRKGLWAAAEGLIYEDWDPAVHLVDPFPVPDDWPRYWSIDWGYVNPFVLQCWAEDPDGRLYLYREIYRTGRTVDQHARDILAVVAPNGVWKEPPPESIVCDHDAENRARFEQELGRSTRAADKRVLHGIQLVQERLRPAGDGKPRLFFFRDAVVRRDPALVEARRPASTVEEITGYVWAPPPDGKPSKDVPLKKDDHGMDAARYLTIERDPGSMPRIRWI